MPGALLTDLYELNMAASYLRRDMRELATFSLYARALPSERGFLVAAGLEPCLAFLEEMSFQEDDLDYLRSELGFDDADLEAFRALRFDGDVWAAPEGTIVFASEPILEVTAPIAVAQLVETFLLNQITTHTTLASKAARYRIAAEGRDLVDFAFRRAHGLDASISAARASAMVGFVATSNVEAARRLGLRAAGTMAHAYVEAFPSEADAFRAYAEDFPERTTFLVDTFDTPNGVRTAIDVMRELETAGELGVRLDSGDLSALSREARTILDDAGRRQVRIFASGGLDELDVQRLVRDGAPIDAFGIGTQMGVSGDAPCFDSVYKLVQYGDRPVLKLSAAKATLPGPKQVFRRESGDDEGGGADVLALRDESSPARTRPLLEPAMRAGRRVGTTASIADARDRFEADLMWLPETARRLENPLAPEPETSAALSQLAEEATARALARLSKHDHPDPAGSR